MMEQAGAHFRRAVVAVLMPREHLPFIRAWCLHHLEDGWEVFLYDNSGSTGSRRKSSAFFRGQLQKEGVDKRGLPYKRYTEGISDDEVSSLMRKELSDLPVTLVRWAPRDGAGRIVHDQVEAYVHFIEQWRNQIDWAAFIDADEYLEAPGTWTWDRLLEQASGMECGRVVLEGTLYETRWDKSGNPRNFEALRCYGWQSDGLKNLVRLAQVRRADIHWNWRMEPDRHIRVARHDFGFRHYRKVMDEPALRVSNTSLRIRFDESVPVASTDEFAGAVHFVFVRIPGVLDIATEDAVKERLHRDCSMEGEGGRLAIDMTEDEPRSVRELEEMASLDGRQVFAVVRNPYERALRLLFQKLSTDPKAKERFVGPRWADDLKRLAAEQCLANAESQGRQVDFLTDASGRLRPDRILRAERLDGLPEASNSCEGSVEALGKLTSSFPWWDFYDEEAKNCIGEAFAADFDALGYDLECPQGGMTGEPCPSVWALDEMPGFSAHRRLEMPDACVTHVSADGIWEELDPSTAARVAGECFRVLKSGGVLEVTTIDLGLMAEAIGAPTNESGEWVRSYLDAQMPHAPFYAPALAVNHCVKKAVFIYDEALLIETLAEGGFSRFERHPAVGKLRVVAVKEPPFHSTEKGGV